MELLSDGTAAHPAAPDYVPLLARPDLSVGVYTIPAGGVDTQSPHTEDEVYICTAGRATLWTPGGSAVMTPGAVTFVPAGEEHRFVEVSADFTVVVAFGPAEASRQPAGQNALLEALAERAEIEVATTLRDGSPGWVPFWVVRVGEGLFARTHREPPATWWREATAAGTTRLRLAPGEPEHAFLVTVVGDMLRPEIDAAYRARFTGDDAQYVPGICSESAVARTVRFRLAPD